MASLNNKQIVIAVDGRKSRLLTEKPLYRCVDGADGMWEFERGGLHLLG